MDNKRPNYRILGFTTSNECDDHQWFFLEIRLNASRFKISVSPARCFRNSAARTAEFEKYHALLLSENEGGDGYDDDEMDAEQGENAPGRPNLVDCFDWAVQPCLAEFETLSPPPPLLEGKQLSLSYFLTSVCYECDLTATDDVLAPGEIELQDPADGELAPGILPEPWTTSFPSFSPAEVVVDCDDSENPFESNPTRVSVGQQQLYFKESSYPDDELAQRQVRTYERIERAQLGDGVRTSRLYGVVRNERQQLLGLLLHRIDEADILAFAVGPDTPDDVKKRWARQIRETVAGLHQAGITWGDAKPDNILIDAQGDAWVIDFGGGRTEGWVDSGKAGSVEGTCRVWDGSWSLSSAVGMGMRAVVWTAQRTRNSGVVASNLYASGRDPWGFEVVMVAGCLCLVRPVVRYPTR